MSHELNQLTEWIRANVLGNDPMSKVIEPDDDDDRPESDASVDSDFEKFDPKEIDRRDREYSEPETVIETPFRAGPLADLTGFQRDLLAIIRALEERAGQPVGLDIKREIDEQYDEEIGTARLYTNLDALVDAGLVTKESVDGRSNAYRLTRRGRREVQSHVEWLRILV